MPKNLIQLQGSANYRPNLGIQNRHYPIAPVDREIANLLVNMSDQRTHQIGSSILRSLENPVIPPRVSPEISQPKSNSSLDVPLENRQKIIQLSRIVASVENVVPLPVMPNAETLEVSFDGKRTNDCLKCKRNIVRLSDKYVNGIVFRCSPRHKGGRPKIGRPMDMKLHFVDLQGNSYVADLKLHSRRFKTPVTNQ